jgi:hypothetical protein
MGVAEPVWGRVFDPSRPSATRQAFAGSGMKGAASRAVESGAAVCEKPAELHSAWTGEGDRPHMACSELLIHGDALDHLIQLLIGFVVLLP